jgi:hypothetical protein
MIAILPVRFADHDDVWPPDRFERWMEPLRPFSLANFWWQSSRGLFDLSSRIYDPVTVGDPRPLSNEGRDAFVVRVIAAATAAVDPDWAHTDILLIWLAQPTGWWGGGRLPVPLRGPGGLVTGTKPVRVTVIDAMTPFDAACQELGHSFGLAHELGRDGVSDYGSPYSVMSAQIYGAGPAASFERPADGNLPDDPPQRIVGPLLPAAQLHVEERFRNSSAAIHLDPSYAAAPSRPARHRLYALNYRLRVPPGPLPVVIAVPSNVNDGRTYFLELRRGLDYDAGLGRPGAPVRGVVVHSAEPGGRIRYRDVCDLQFGDNVDWRFPAGDFSVRVNGIGPDQEYVDVTIRGGARTWFPIRGALLAGGVATQAQLTRTRRGDQRNALIAELARRSRSPVAALQMLDDDALAGAGAAMLFLRLGGIRDDRALADMSVDDQRNTLIVEVSAQTGLPIDRLQTFDSLELVRLGLGGLPGGSGEAPGAVGSYIRGVLLAGGFRTQQQLNAMSHADRRNTLIVELAAHSRDTASAYQAFSDEQLEGAGAVMVLLRAAGLRDDAALRAMSAEDQRNTLIVEVEAQLGISPTPQGWSDLELVLTVLGIGVRVTA